MLLTLYTDIDFFVYDFCGGPRTSLGRSWTLCFRLSFVCVFSGSCFAKITENHRIETPTREDHLPLPRPSGASPVRERGGAQLLPPSLNPSFFLGYMFAPSLMNKSHKNTTLNTSFCWVGKCMSFVIVVQSSPDLQIRIFPIQSEFDHM